MLDQEYFIFYICISPNGSESLSSLVMLSGLILPKASNQIDTSSWKLQNEMNFRNGFLEIMIFVKDIYF